MVLVERANPTDRAEIERLIAAYHAWEGVKPRAEKIAWAVEQQLRNRFPGLLLVARDKKAVVGVTLAVYMPSAEYGRVLQVQDFFVDPSMRRKGVGKALAAKLLDEAKAMRIDRLDVEVATVNTVASAFWKAMGFRPNGRAVYGRDLIQRP